MGDRDNELNVAFLRDVARAMGADVNKTETLWQAGRAECWLDGRRFCLDYAERPKRHVTVSGWWPHFRHPYGSTVVITPRDARAIKHGEMPPECSASVDRGAEAIAKDFARRFWPEFARIWDACIAQVRLMEAEAVRTMELARELSREFDGNEPRAETGSYGHGTESSFYVSKIGKVRVEARGDAPPVVSFESRFYSLSLGHARRILAVICECESESHDAEEAARDAKAEGQSAGAN